MKALIAKTFPYAADGLKAKRLNEGEEHEIRDELIEGLEKEGYIVVGLPLTNEQKASVTDIPDDWQTLKPAELKKLAGKLSGEKIDDVEVAKAFIANEVDARAKAAEDAAASGGQA